MLGRYPSVARLLSQCSLDATVQSLMWTCNSVSVDVQLEGARVAVQCSCRCSSSSRVHCSTGESSVLCLWAFYCSYLLLIFLIYKDVVRFFFEKLHGFSASLLKGEYLRGSPTDT